MQTEILKAVIDWNRTANEEVYGIIFNDPTTKHHQQDVSSIWT
jgi:hypothetical protein